MKEIVQKETFEQVMRDVLEYKLQGAIKGLLHKFFPVRVLDIRVLKIEPIEYTEKESLTVEIPQKKEEGIGDEEIEEKIEQDSESTEEEAMEEAEEESPNAKKSKKKVSE